MSGKSGRAWDPWRTFKVSDAERDLIDRRRLTRDKFREEFNKLYTDPRKEVILDHNFERWHAYRNQQVQLMNIWHKENIVKGFLVGLFPCIVFAIFMKRAMVSINNL